MRRTTTVALVLGTLLVSTAGSAQAARPIVIKPAPADAVFPLPAGAVCPFDVLFEATGKGGQKLFSDGRAITTSPGLKVTVTNLAPGGASWSTVATGAFHDQPIQEMEDGFRFRSHMTGHNLLFGSFDDGTGPEPGMRKFVGSIDVTVTVSFIDGVVFSEIDDHAARVTDVCAALA